MLLYKQLCEDHEAIGTKMQSYIFCRGEKSLIRKIPTFNY